MEILTQGNTLTLTKNGVPIGHCQYALLPTAPLGVGAAQGAAYEIVSIALLPQWRRKGYGSFLLKELLKRTGGYDPKQATCYRVALPTPQGEGVGAFFAKFAFVPSGGGSATLIRHKKPDLTATRLMQQQVRGHLAQSGGSAPFCIDATCGNGHDALFLAQCLPAAGHLLALDIQPQAIAQTQQRLQGAGILPAQYTLHCADHAALAQYAVPQSADVIVFNFGWLPGADHGVFSHPQSSLPALAAALDILKPGGMLCATLYSGEGIGDAEKTAVLAWLQTLPPAQYTVLACQFANWAPTAPLPCFVLKK